MMKPKYPYFLANEAHQSNTDLEVTDKYTGEIATYVAIADTQAIDQAIGAAARATDPMRRLPPYERQKILNHCVVRFEQRQSELAMALCVEAGKPIKDSRGEVTRLIDTFRIAAEEAVRIDGDVLNLEISERARGYRGMVKRVPIGPCSFISPFNFPLNLAAHKVAPAIAAGCPFVLKPASRTPIGALLIGEILAEMSPFSPFTSYPNPEINSLTFPVVTWSPPPTVTMATLPSTPASQPLLSRKLFRVSSFMNGMTMSLASAPI